MKQPRPSKEEVAKALEEEVRASIPLARQALSNNLWKFNRYILKVEEGKDKVPLAPFHRELTDFVSKNPQKKKLVLVPRGHLKSTLVTVGYSLMKLLANPSIRILIANATYNLACSFLTDIKRQLKFNEQIHMVWGDLSRNPEKWSENEVMLHLMKQSFGRKEPNITAMGVESNLTSQHYDLIIFDDLVNEKLINTQEQIDKTINFYKEALNLLEPDGECIIVGTRFHDSDLYGWIMDNDNNVLSDFEIMVKKAFEGDLDGECELLFPRKFTVKHLKRLRDQLGPYIFSSQYLNDCIPSESADFKKDWFRYYEHTDLRGSPLNTFTMIDPAISLEKEADFTAIVTVSLDHRSNIYVRDIRRIKGKPSDVINEIFLVYEQWHPIYMGIEEVAFQKALQYSLHEEMVKRQRFLPLKEVKPQARTKDQRIRGLQPLYANAKVYHNKEVKNILHLEDELLRFPRGKHDDIIDSLSYGLDFWYPGKRKVTAPRKHRYLYA